VAELPAIQSGAAMFQGEGALERAMDALEPAARPVR